jgi:hypothetical protein
LGGADEAYEPPTLYVVGRFEELTLALKVSGVSDGMSSFHNHS